MEQVQSRVAHRYPSKLAKHSIVIVSAHFNSCRESTGTRSVPPATTLFGPIDEIPVFHQNLKHKSWYPIEFLSDQERIRAGFLDDMT